MSQAKFCVRGTQLVPVRSHGIPTRCFQKDDKEKANSPRRSGVHEKKSCQTVHNDRGNTTGEAEFTSRFNKVETCHVNQIAGQTSKTCSKLIDQVKFKLQTTLPPRVRNWR